MSKKEYLVLCDISAKLNVLSAVVNPKFNKEFVNPTKTAIDLVSQMNVKLESILNPAMMRIEKIKDEK